VGRHVSYSQTLEEVVVTATRRAQNIQDIPIAVTAVTPLQLERQGVDDLGELGNVSASFNLQFLLTVYTNLDQALRLAN